MASRQAHTDVLGLLLTFTAYYDAQKTTGWWSPIMYAVGIGHVVTLSCPQRQAIDTDNALSVAATES